MSKKKAINRSTMTLKDFHGGSIPSDLPLPSAPGVTARPSDRPGFDRPIGGGSWGGMGIGGGIGRSDHHRPRPGSAGGVRGFDEAAPFLSHPAHIGRNFDEDERKPFDAPSVHRRPLPSEDPVRLPRSPDVKQQPVPGRPALNPAAAVHHSSGGPVFPSAGPSPSTASGNSGSSPNAWAVRKEVVSEPQVHSAMTWSGPAAASRFAQASAIEKISSGRWQSKHTVLNQPPDVEVIRFPDTDGSDVRLRDNNEVFVGGSDLRYGLDGRHGERVDGSDRRSTESIGSRDYELVRSPVYPEAKDRSAGPGFSYDRARPASTDGRVGGMQVYQQGTTEGLERPKLKLIPRTKPLEPSEMQISDYKQDYLPPSMNPENVENISAAHGNQNSPKPGSAGFDGGNRAVERPRLNLKPRSQPLELSDESIEKERQTVFGGARPRELVLKERGIDNNTPNNLNQSLPANRVKHESVKMDVKPEPAAPTSRHGERPENYPLDPRGRDLERKDHRTEPEKIDVQRGSWRNDNRKNIRENEKLPERRQEPDSWRKPVDQPKPEPKLDTPGPRYGKAASALELAQVFSRSVSDARSDSHFTSQRSQPGHNQVPFSRLTDTRELYSGSTPRQINGY